MLVASEVLPIPGRPARIIKSDACNPPIFSSSVLIWVAIPDNCEERFFAALAISIAFLTASLKFSNPPPYFPFSASSNN